MFRWSPGADGPSRTRLLRPGALALVAAAVSACQGPPLRFHYDLADTAGETTVGGLREVEVSQVGAAYLKPDIDFSGYHSVLLEAVTLSSPDHPRPATGFDRGPGNYPLSPEARERVRRTLQHAFEREVAESREFDLASEAGPGALRVTGRVVGFVWMTPPPQGSEDYVVRRNGVMTLILEIADAATGELLALIADRRQIQPEGIGSIGFYENSPANQWTAVRHVSERWGPCLREALEGLKELPPAPVR